MKSTDDDRAETLERFEAMERMGYSAAQIAAELNVCTRTVVRWRRATGRSHPTPEGWGVPLTPERLEAARAMLADGASRAEVARTLHMWDQTLAKHFPEAKWTKAQAGRFANEVRKLNKLMERIN